MKFGLALNDLRLKAIIGILPLERESAQEIAVDLEAIYEVDFVDCHDLPKASLAMTSGDDSHKLSHNEGKIVDYAILREIILDSFKQHNFLYLESALVAIQGAILEQFPQILELNLSVKKLAIFSDCTPQVRLSWSKDLDCHDLPKASLAMTSEGDSHKSPRKYGQKK